jgi:hypothetical protein
MLKMEVFQAHFCAHATPVFHDALDALKSGAAHPKENMK